MAEVKQKSIKKNFIMNAILTMSGFIFPIITYPYIMRVIGPDGTGPIRFATSVVAYFVTFAQLGVSTYGVRVCAKVRDNKEELSRTLHELFSINLIMSIISYIVLFTCIFTVPRFQRDKTILMIISLSIFFDLIGVEYLYKALEQYTYITIRSVIFKLIAIILMFLFVNQKEDYTIYGAITIFAASASGVFNFIHSRKFISFKWLGGYNLKKHWKAIVVFFAMSCSTTLYHNLDGVMMGFMTSDADVGYYDAAIKFKTILVSVVTSLGVVLLPRASYYVEHKEMDEFRSISNKAFNFVFIFAVLLMIYFIMFSREAILFLSGEQFIPAIFAMQLIMPALLFIGVTNILGIQILVPLGKEKIVLYSEVTGAIVNLIINALLIPGMKAAGAALGTTIAEFVVFVVQYYYMRENIEDVKVKDILSKISYWKIVLSVLIASAVSFWVKMIDISFISSKIMVQNLILIVISGGLFFGGYLISMLLLGDKLTKEILNTLLSKIKKKG